MTLRKYAPLVPLLLTQVCALWLVAPSSIAAADALPASLRAAVGPRSALAVIAVDADDGDTRIRVGTGRHADEARIRGVVTDVTAQSVLTSGGRVAIVRATGGSEIAAVIGVRAGAPAILWSGRLELHGDPGERAQDALVLGDRDGDGIDELIVGTRRESLALCGEEPALTATRALHDGAFVGVELRPTSSPGGSELVATATSPGPSGPPVVPALRFVAASSDSGSSDAFSVGAPSGLADGSTETGWAEGRSGGGMGEVVSGRWAAPIPIRALALRGGPGYALPSRVVFVGDGGVRLVVTIPADVGDVAWVVPPAPLSWSCISFVIEEPGASATAPTGFAEIEAFTDYDFGRGLEALVDELVADGEIGERATVWLARAGAPAIELVLTAWPRLGALGRRRAVRVASTTPPVPESRAAELLGLAARDDEEDVRTDALTAMRRLRAIDLLVIAARAEGAAGEAAARMLAELPYEAAIAVEPLLESLGEPGGTERPELRRAIARAARAQETERVSAWAEGAPTGALCAATLALAARDDDEGRTLARTLFILGSSRATEFADLYRLTRAAVALGEAGSLEIDAWLRAQVTSAETWMVRAGAVEALGARADASTMSAALDDVYPRVRALAVIARRAQPESVPTLAVMARSDGWPIVRLAALDAISSEPEAAAAARVALDDRVAAVRARGIEILVVRGDQDALPLVLGRLVDRDEWPEVSRAALQYVEAFCLEGAGDALITVIERGGAEGAWAPDVDTAIEALGVAMRIGGDVATRARRVALSGGAATEALASVLDRAEALPSCHD